MWGIKCCDCEEYRNDWCEKVMDSPNPDIIRGCQYYHEKDLDVIKVIRCKDCKYYIPYEWMFDGLSRSSRMEDYASDEIGCAVNDHNYSPEGFCSNAERREEGDE